VRLCHKISSIASENSKTGHQVSARNSAIIYQIDNCFSSNFQPADALYATQQKSLQLMPTPRSAWEKKLPDTNWTATEKWRCENWGTFSRRRWALSQRVQSDNTNDLCLLHKLPFSHKRSYTIKFIRVVFCLCVFVSKPGGARHNLYNRYPISVWGS